MYVRIFRFDWGLISSLCKLLLKLFSLYTGNLNVSKEMSLLGIIVQFAWEVFDLESRLELYARGYLLY